MFCPIMLGAITRATVKTAISRARRERCIRGVPDADLIAVVAIDKVRRPDANETRHARTDRLRPAPIVREWAARNG